MKPLVNFRLTKVDEEQRLVYGIAAAEEVDKSGEILDYESSKPLIQQWSEETRKATESAGQETSYGNVRVMHGMTVAGPLRSIEFDDAARSVSVCAQVLDDEAWRMTKAGAYTGFSIGGDYAKRWYDPEAKAVRYTAAPKEFSIVDNPCAGSAHFTVVKVGGAVETRAFRAKEAFMDWDSLTKVIARGLLRKSLASAGDASALVEQIRQLGAQLSATLSDPAAFQAALDKLDAAAIKALQAEIAASADDKPEADAAPEGGDAASGDKPEGEGAPDEAMADAAGMKPQGSAPLDGKQIAGKPQPPADGAPAENPDDPDDAAKCGGPTNKAATAGGEGELLKLAKAAKAEAAELRAALQKSADEQAKLAAAVKEQAARIEALAKTARPIGRPAENASKTLGVEDLLKSGPRVESAADVNAALDVLRKAGASAETMTKLTIEAATALNRRG